MPNLVETKILIAKIRGLLNDLEKSMTDDEGSYGRRYMRTKRIAEKVGMTVSQYKALLERESGPGKTETVGEAGER